MHNYQLRVYYEDTDAGGVVYHSNYLNFAERARTEMMRNAGFEHAEILEKQNIAFAVRHLTIDYKLPAKLDDILTIKTTIINIGGASMDLQQIIIDGNNNILTEINLKLVCMNINNKKAVRLPKECREIFSKML